MSFSFSALIFLLTNAFIVSLECWKYDTAGDSDYLFMVVWYKLVNVWPRRRFSTIQYFYLALFSIIFVFVGAGGDSLFACLLVLFFFGRQTGIEVVCEINPMLEEWDWRVHLKRRYGGETWVFSDFSCFCSDVLWHMHRSAMFIGSHLRRWAYTRHWLIQACLEVTHEGKEA